MPSWAPGPEDIDDELHDRQVDRLDAAMVLRVIGKAVNEVIAEVGHFDATAVINPDADLADRVTLGDLAKEAAAARAAEFIETGSYPEQQGLGGVELSPTQRLYLRYRDRVERLKGWIARLDDDVDGVIIGTQPWAGSIPLHLPSVPRDS